MQLFPFKNIISDNLQAVCNASTLNLKKKKKEAWSGRKIPMLTSLRMAVSRSAQKPREKKEAKMLVCNSFDLNTFFH